MPRSTAAPAGWPLRHASPPGWSPADPSSLGWLILIPLGCVLLGQALLAWSGVVPVLDGVLADPDAYMRLNRVLELHEGGAWFDSRYPRIGPPEGHVQHWTRPLDLLLLIGAWLLQPALGFEQALHVFGVALSPLCLVLVVLALAWAAQPILDRDARMLACLALLWQPMVLGYSSLGRPDHHALLLLLFVLLLGFTFRLLADPYARRRAEPAGLVAALAVWVSPEALVFIAPSLVALGWIWLLGKAGMAAAIQRYLVALALALAAALLVERGFDGYWAVENDRLSLLQLTLFGALALVWTLITAVERAYRLRRAAPAEPTTSPLAPLDSSRHKPAVWPAMAIRAGLAAGGGLGVALGLIALFPELRTGPLGQVDPLYAQVRLHRIAEIQPLLSPRWHAAGDLGQQMRRVVRFLGLAFLALPFLVMLLVREHGAARRIWGYVGLTLAIFLGLAFHQIRWGSYTQILLVLTYGAFLGWLLRRLAEQVSARALPVCRPALIFAGMLGPVLVLLLLPQQRIERADAACPVQRLAPVLEQLAGGSSRTVMTFADYGPELLYRTRHSVLSIPNHRPQRGFTATYVVLSRASEGLARAMLAEHGVDWILLCPGKVERSVFAADGEDGDTLYARLAEGAPPPWLRPLPLPDDLTSQARLYAISPAPAMAGEDASDAERL